MSLNVLSICRTSLHYACAHNHPDVVTLLLENNSSINIRDDEGCTPLIKVAIGHLFWHEMDRGCPCLVSLAVIKHQKQLRKGSGYLAYIYTSQIILKGNQGRSSNQELEGRTELEFTGECSFSMASTKPCSGVYFLLLLLFLFFNKIEDFVPGMPQLLKPRLSYFYLNLKLKKKKSPHS